MNTAVTAIKSLTIPIISQISPNKGLWFNGNYHFLTCPLQTQH